MADTRSKTSRSWRLDVTIATRHYAMPRFVPRRVALQRNVLHWIHSVALRPAPRRSAMPRNTPHCIATHRLPSSKRSKGIVSGLGDQPSRHALRFNATRRIAAQRYTALRISLLRFAALYRAAHLNATVHLALLQRATSRVARRRDASLLATYLPHPAAHHATTPRSAAQGSAPYRNATVYLALFTSRLSALRYGLALRLAT